VYDDGTLVVTDEVEVLEEVAAADEEEADEDDAIDDDTDDSALDDALPTALVEAAETAEATALPAPARADDTWLT